MSWTASKESIRLAIAAALKMPDYTGADGVAGGSHVVEWEHKKKSVRFLPNDSAWATIRMTTPIADGLDETRYVATNGPTAELSKWVPLYGGRRSFTVSVLIGSASQEDGYDSVGERAGLLRTRLRRREILDALHAAGVGLTSIFSTTEADYVDSTNRWVSASVTDIKFSCVEFDTDVNDLGDFVSSVQGLGELTNVDGSIINSIFDVPTQDLVESLQAQVSGLSFSFFESDYYSLSAGKVDSWLERSTHPGGVKSIAPLHAMVQGTVAQQCATPTADALFGGRPSASFVDQRYFSTAPASAWSFLHDGTGCTVYTVFALDSVASSSAFLLATNSGIDTGIRFGFSVTLPNVVLSNGAAIIAVPNVGTAVVNTPYYYRFGYEEGVSGETSLYEKTTLLSAVNTTGSPSSGAPGSTLLLGNRTVVVDSPFVGRWLSTIIVKGPLSLSTDSVIKQFISVKYGVI